MTSAPYPPATPRLPETRSEGEYRNISTRLEEALPIEEQDAIAEQILATLADEEAWQRPFAEKRDTIRRMAAEAMAQDERGETVSLGSLL
jgi:hypothetical protein